MSTSIVIPVHNQKHLLQVCVDSIIEKSKKSDYQIILVDDASDKETADFCQELYNEGIVQQLVRNNTAKGFSISCNLGMQLSKNFDYVCLLNSDTRIVTEDWLEKISSFWENKKDVGCLGVLSNCATTQSVGKEVVKEESIEEYGEFIISLSERKYPNTGFVNGFCFFISSLVIKQVGLLDARVFPHYGSEDDFVLRIQQKKFKLVICDEVYVYHYSNQSYGEKRNHLVRYSYSTLVKKWGPKLVRQNGLLADKALSYLKSKIADEVLKTCADKKVLYDLGTQYLSLENYEKALAVWEKLLNKDAKDHYALAYLGTTMNLLNDFQQAEKLFLQSIDIEESEYALIHLGVCYAKQERFEDAYYTLKKVVQKTYDVKALTDFAFCCGFLKKYDEAIAILEKSLKMDKEYTLSTGLLEKIYNEKGIELSTTSVEKSIKMFKKSLVINPRFEPARKNLNVMLKR